MSKRLNSYFNTNQELRQLSCKAAQLKVLQELYEHLAPSSLARFSHVHAVELQTLVLAASNGAVAAKLRQLAPQLAGQFRNAGHEVTRIQVRVQVGSYPASRVSAGRKLGADGRNKLVELAGELPDSPLKRALQRLAGK
ncbi:MAG: DUF721 domain-containing protein [Gallionellaceae bacterium]|nr:DUF721 domain-containing protein [Gallionellaceae bacterium]